MEHADNEDSELITAAAAGDGRAWSQLVDRHAPLVWSVGRGCGLQKEDAEDVAQTVFTALVRRLPHLRDHAALSGWLVVSAKREAWRVSTRNRLHAGRGGDSEEAQGQVAPGDPGLIERQHAVRASLARQDARCRTLLIELFGVGDQPSYEDIADRLGLLPNSVGPTRRRCLDKLLEDLEKSAKGLF